MEPITADILVLGAGPGGYTAAFHAADKGKKVILVEQNPRLGGVCMNFGCIPSKALLHATAAMREAKESSQRGIEFGHVNLNLEKLRGWKESIVEKLGQGIKSLAQHRNVEVVHGRGHFEDSQTLRVETGAGQKFIRYEKAIIAVGSKPMSLKSDTWIRKLAAYAIVSNPRFTASLKMRSVTRRGNGSFVFLSLTSSIRISRPTPSTKPTNG